MLSCSRKLYLVIVGLLFLAVTAQAQSNYTLGIGDQIRMTVYGQPELAAEAQINSDGTVTLPLLGSVQVLGHSSAEAAKLITDLYERGNFLKRQTLTFRNFLCYQSDKTGIVSFSSKGLRGHIGTISFNKESVRRYIFCYP